MCWWWRHLWIKVLWFSFQVPFPSAFFGVIILVVTVVSDVSAMRPPLVDNFTTIMKWSSFWSKCMFQALYLWRQQWRFFFFLFFFLIKQSLCLKVAVYLLSWKFKIYAIPRWWRQNCLINIFRWWRRWISGWGTRHKCSFSVRLITNLCAERYLKSSQGYQLANLILH